MLIVIEFLFTGIIADRVNDAFYKITKTPKPVPETLPDDSYSSNSNDEAISEANSNENSDINTKTADTTEAITESPQTVETTSDSDDEINNEHPGSMLTQEEYAALISPESDYPETEEEADELEWPNLPQAPETLPPEYNGNDDFENSVHSTNTENNASTSDETVIQTAEEKSENEYTPESYSEDDPELEFPPKDEIKEETEEVVNISDDIDYGNAFASEDLSDIDNTDFGFDNSLSQNFDEEVSSESDETSQNEQEDLPQTDNQNESKNTESPYSVAKYLDNVVENSEYPHNIQLHSDSDDAFANNNVQVENNDDQDNSPKYPTRINLGSNYNEFSKIEKTAPASKKDEAANKTTAASETKEVKTANTTTAPVSSPAYTKTTTEPQTTGYRFSSHHIPPEQPEDRIKKEEAPKKSFSTAISDIFADMKDDIHKKHIRENYPEMTDEEFETFYSQNRDKLDAANYETNELNNNSITDSAQTDEDFQDFAAQNEDDSAENDDIINKNNDNLNDTDDFSDDDFESNNTPKKLDLDSEIAEYDEFSDESDAIKENEQAYSEDSEIENSELDNYEFNNEENSSAVDDLSMYTPPEEDASDLTADDLENFFNAQQAENIPQTSEIKGNLPTTNRATKKGPYVIPSDLLTAYKDDQYWVIDDDTKKASLMLKQTLAEFHIEAEIIGIKKGPVVTMFEILPAPGVKLQRIVSLQDNIALALAAKAVRIVAPIPGKQAVGIEVPNKDRSIVGFREIIEMDLPEYNKMTVPVVLGKDILGKAQLIDLVKTPHMLIAGATGSGKSVCVNSLILSILYKRSYKDVKLILVDPKVVELKLYNNIPHLLTPVITEPKKAFQALQYCLCEMERRYALLDGIGVRDIASYNQRIKERNICTEKLPYIVVIIDEFADLMATTGRELESVVARLTAMSRAVGIHLVLATQRPSVNVITGLIKANIPSRIAFMVASRTDSNIIIDSVGAEKLLGRGDMLYASAVDPFPVRIQGTYVTDQEVENVVEYVKQFGEPDYIDDEIFIEDEEEVSENVDLFGNPVDDDPLYDQALEIVVQAGKASASYIQRRLKIGYNRAARLVEEMEERGIVGPANGSKARELIHVP